MKKRTIALVFGVVAVSFLLGCSGAKYKKQGYAALSNTKEFEEEYPVVWKGVVAALSTYKIKDKDQEEGLVKTDWIYTTSNDKYVEYKVNGLPRKKYLQTRYQMEVKIQKQMGSIKVTVVPREEIETLKSDGSFDDWDDVSDPDTTRSNDLIKNIEMKILARPNI